MDNTEKLYRSETDRIIAGVAGGLGEYFEVDPSLLRLIFLITTLAGGSGVLIYLVLWLVIPTQSALSAGVASQETVKNNVKEMEAKAKDVAESVSGAESKKKNDKDQAGVKSTHSRPKKHNSDSRRWFGIFLLIVGGLWFMRNMGWVAPRMLWPLTLLVLGFLILIG